ncbi:hypothetical protein M231_02564 [Tremella mesenterica]|uniref:BZIP domain-containing protein n=2 Tax=Tremella mesenterica TaxID=5217 RepID=A0A4V1M4E7_TREME|nr:hypothetical protein M231_02564 [Tremella mesenterica]
MYGRLQPPRPARPAAEPPKPRYLQPGPSPCLPARTGWAELPVQSMRSPSPHTGYSTHYTFQNTPHPESRRKSDEILPDSRGRPGDRGNNVGGKSVNGRISLLADIALAEAQDDDPQRENDASTAQRLRDHRPSLPSLATAIHGSNNNTSWSPHSGFTSEAPRARPGTRGVVSEPSSGDVPLKYDVRSYSRDPRKSRSAFPSHPPTSSAPTHQNHQHHNVPQQHHQNNPHLAQLMQTVPIPNRLHSQTQSRSAPHPLTSMTLDRDYSGHSVTGWHEEAQHLLRPPPPLINGHTSPGSTGSTSPLKVHHPHEVQWDHTTSAGMAVHMVKDTRGRVVHPPPPHTNAPTPGNYPQQLPAEQRQREYTFVNVDGERLAGGYKQNGTGRRASKDLGEKIGRQTANITTTTSLTHPTPVHPTMRVEEEGINRPTHYWHRTLSSSTTQGSDSTVKSIQHSDPLPLTPRERSDLSPIANEKRSATSTSPRRHSDSHDHIEYLGQTNGHNSSHILEEPTTSLPTPISVLPTTQIHPYSHSHSHSASWSDGTFAFSGSRTNDIDGSLSPDKRRFGGSDTTSSYSTTSLPISLIRARIEQSPGRRIKTEPCSPASPGETCSVSPRSEICLERPAKRLRLTLHTASSTLCNGDLEDICNPKDNMLHFDGLRDGDAMSTDERVGDENEMNRDGDGEKEGKKKRRYARRSGPKRKEQNAKAQKKFRDRKKSAGLRMAQDLQLSQRMMEKSKAKIEELEKMLKESEESKRKMKDLEERLKETEKKLGEIEKENKGLKGETY